MLIARNTRQINVDSWNMIESYLSVFWKELPPIKWGGAKRETCATFLHRARWLTAEPRHVNAKHFTFKHVDMKMSIVDINTRLGFSCQVSVSRAIFRPCHILFSSLPQFRYGQVSSIFFSGQVSSKAQVCHPICMRKFERYALLTRGDGLLSMQAPTCVTAFARAHFKVALRGSYPADESKKKIKLDLEVSRIELACVPPSKKKESLLARVI